MVRLLFSLMYVFDGSVREQLARNSTSDELVKQFVNQEHVTELTSEKEFGKEKHWKEQTLPWLYSGDRPSVPQDTGTWWHHQSKLLLWCWVKIHSRLQGLISIISIKQVILSKMMWHFCFHKALFWGLTKDDWSPEKSGSWCKDITKSRSTECRDWGGGWRLGIEML